MYSFDTNDIPYIMHTHTFAQVFDVLLAPKNLHNPSDEALYPHVRTLLEFDTREFLNVIALVGLNYNPLVLNVLLNLNYTYSTKWLCVLLCVWSNGAHIP